ncbi:MAG: anti-sigma factor [Acidobacteriia bacterium]|nr:anti-sigma factor [Terriglobia bacterium]MBV8905650.1 anti-sigma factor [Terriglobia bacterium]MBV9743366.1 anti-sigma factor [Terriglobia bacterium]
MNCETLRDHYEIYALGIAEEPERGEIQAHLARDCEVCMTEIGQARELISLLGCNSDLATPSAGLRRRILASVGLEQRRASWWTPVWGVAAVTSIAMAVFAASFFRGRERDLSEQLAAAREQIRTQTLDLTRLNEAFAILNGPDTAVSSFSQTGPQAPPKGKVFLNPDRGVLLLASNLPPAAAGKTYEMWLLPKRGMPQPAGLFQSASDGTALYIRRGAVDLAGTMAVAVTLENAGGAPQPTTQPLIVAPLPNRG